jgi:hypothetical protein
MLCSWDKEEYEYKIVESLIPLDEETEYDEYVFVVRARIGESPNLCAKLSFLTARPDKKDEKVTRYIDVKSVELRDVLRSVLKDVNGMCLRAEKPSVRPH